MRRNPRYVTADGGVWRLSETAYKRMLREIRNTGDTPDPGQYGPLITTQVESLSDIVNTVVAQTRASIASAEGRSR